MTTYKHEATRNEGSTGIDRTLGNLKLAPMLARRGYAGPRRATPERMPDCLVCGASSHQRYYTASVKPPGGARALRRRPRRS